MLNVLSSCHYRLTLASAWDSPLQRNAMVYNRAKIFNSFLGKKCRGKECDALSIIPCWTKRICSRREGSTNLPVKVQGKGFEPQNTCKIIEFLL
jgi:hypothetical protein